jgi:hypothetical protein
MDFGNFLSALYADWVGLMSGIASLILTVTGFFQKEDQRRRLFWILALLCFLIASVRIWTSEHHLRVQLEDHNPHLNALVRHAFLHYYDNNAAVLLVLLEIGNPGDKPSVARDFTLTLRTGSAQALVHHPNSALNFELGPASNNTRMVVLGEELLQHRCSTTPIISGAVSIGWLLFDIRGHPEGEVLHASITFKDILDQPHSISLKEIQKVPPLPPTGTMLGYPGITYPFQSQSNTEKMMKQGGSAKQQ